MQPCTTHKLLLQAASSACSQRNQPGYCLHYWLKTTQGMELPGKPKLNPAFMWLHADYESSCVQGLNLDTLKAVHRLSYGHRGRRSMLVVVYDPEHAACREAEAEVRLQGMQRCTWQLPWTPHDPHIACI